MRTLDRSKPYTSTFGPDTSTIPFFQNGLYYNHAGDLVDIKHNRLHLASLGIDPDQLLSSPKSAKASLPGAQDPGVQNTPVQADPPAPTTTLSLSSLEPPAGDAGGEPDPLVGHSDVQIFGLAQRLRAQLDVSEDGDNYVPTIDNAQGNREFVIRHLKGEGQE